jgi:hypothetical protein
VVTDHFIFSFNNNSKSTYEYSIHVIVKKKYKFPAKKTMRRAMVVGVSGNLGKLLVQKLVNNKLYKYVIVFTRMNERKLKHIHIKKVIVDFNQIHLHKEEFLACDEVYCLLGSQYTSTVSVENSSNLDFEIPLEIAKMAKSSGVRRFVLINPHVEFNKSTVYIQKRLKLENTINQMGFEDFKIFKVNQISVAKNWTTVRKRINQIQLKIIGLFGRKIEGYLKVPANILVEDITNWATQQPELLNQNN